MRKTVASHNTDSAPHHARSWEWLAGRHPGLVNLVALGLLVLAGRASAQAPDSAPTAPAHSVLKGLSLEELMNIEVTSVSRRPERLSETASAIQVITGDDIRRSGASSLPEALRLAANLQVAQANSSQWAISARGFNNVIANKLLVLIDGRTVYTPLYAGVFWDVQNPPLEAVDRIEVISGPGGALWGANAVNGVINVITKNASETQGWSIHGGGGTELKGFGGLRQGGHLSSNLSYRVYGHAFSRGSTALASDGTDANDSWTMGQGGLRMDWKPGADNHLTFQSDYTDGRPDPDGGSPVVARGGNVLGRWTRVASESSDLQLQVYYDRTWRDFGNGFTEGLSTYDLDWQHRFQLGRRQEVIWGFGFRLMDHQTENLPGFAFLPSHKRLPLYSAFLQDEIAVAADRLRLTLGSKIEHNAYTGFEVQPSARLTWSPTERHAIWAGVARAVRTPARIDREFFLDLAPTVPFIVGDDFQSEVVLAYELGWRLQPHATWSFSLSTFYNVYDNLRSVEPGPPPFGLPITFANGVRGHVYGVELAALVQLTDHWRLRGGCTVLRQALTVKPGSNDLNEGRAESNDPRHHCTIQSSADLPGRLELGVLVRYVDALPAPPVPSYVGLDIRVGWRPIQLLELALAGQNLLQDKHPEFIPSSPSARQIERSIFGKVVFRW